jgi:hypothetical protein
MDLSAVPPDCSNHVLAPCLTLGVEPTVATQATVAAPARDRRP